MTVQTLDQIERIIVKSKNTYTLSFGFAAFVVAQFIAPLTFIVVF